MTPEQQKVAIKEACGWTGRHYAHKCDGVTIFRCGACGGIGHSNCYGNGQGAISFSCSESPCCEEAVPPNYPFDLNAMHEVESILNADQMVSYDYHLDRVVGNGRQGLNIEYFLWSATASQRAEAFLRTIGKWEEEK